MDSDGDKPLSTGGWSEEIVTLERATVVPPVESGFVQAAGVLDARGVYCPRAAMWRKFRPLTTAPDRPETVTDTLSGRWIWGGVLWSHFGHFLAESTARLWALDAVDGPVDGLLFVPKRPRNEDRLKGFHKPFFDLMGVDVPIRVVTAPTEVEDLIVPGQGFGLGEISAGTQKVRAQYASRFAADVAPEGPEKLYVSRSALGLSRGSILGEPYLEDRLRQEGYEVFHPQEHPLEVQVARYRAARQVVATDGSALHLLAMAMPEDQRVAIVARRRSSAVDLLARHVDGFTGTTPLVITALHRSWFPEGRRKVKRLALGELSLPDVGRRLAEAGFVSDGSDWRPLQEAEVRAALQASGMGWYTNRGKRVPAAKAAE